MDEELEFNKVYQKIQELLRSGSKTISILESQVDMEIQLAYFQYSRKLKDSQDQEIALKNIALLSDSDITIEQKKDILSRLAKLDNPEAYRAIEKYRENSDEELLQWSILALQESRMVLETSLLGTTPIFISTGLGGQGDKLRYFVVMVAAEDRSFEIWQEDLLQKELDFVIQQHDGVTESVLFEHDKVLVTALLPITINIKDIFSEVVKECNQFGDFLLRSFIVTNVKKLESDEIQKMVDKYRSDQNSKTQ